MGLWGYGVMGTNARKRKTTREFVVVQQQERICRENDKERLRYT
jgi:hypothetical protein